MRSIEQLLNTCQDTKLMECTLGRMPASERRELIIAAAQRVLLAKGLLAATTRDVTNELGVAAGLLTHYFTWMELRSIAFERIVRADLQDLIGQDRDEQASLVMKTLIAEAFSETADPIWRLWLEAIEVASCDSWLAAVVVSATELLQAGLADLINRGCNERAWCCDDPTDGSWRILAVLYGLAGLSLVPDAKLSRAHATRHLGIAVGHECRCPDSQGKNT
jgi:AcrR family transcriptional regulator